METVGRPFEDQIVIDIAGEISGRRRTGRLADVGERLVVFGAHLRGQPLNHQLEKLGARFAAEVLTAPRYQMVALSGVPAKPGILHDPVAGSSLAGELWTISKAGLGSFLAALPEPMRLGRVELADGTAAIGFHCDPVAARGAPDITAAGSWRAYLESRR